MSDFKILGRDIGLTHPTYFVADIAASHDGSLDRAVELIHLAAQAGADAAKFQNFTASEIVSDAGFRELGKLSHQSKWEKGVSQVYEDASIPHAWTPILRSACAEAGIHYFSAAYDFKAIDMLEPFVPVYKVGSGDVDWLEALDYTAKKGKPMLVATGASSIEDVIRAVDVVLENNVPLVLMQCNTNYTASKENFKYINLNVLKTYSVMFPDVVLGLSDHTPGHATVLGAIALGARVVEKHFTDDVTRPGPDHAFSMTAQTWRDMVDRSRELEEALGTTVKRVEENELDTVVIQRRGIRAGHAIKAGSILGREDFTLLRPAPAHGLTANSVVSIIGMKVNRDIDVDEIITAADLTRV
jgi:sialic acid synthase SpsE